MKNKKHCYDSLEDYLVTHPKEEVSERAIFITALYGEGEVNKMNNHLKEIPESSEYFKWLEKNK